MTRQSLDELMRTLQDLVKRARSGGLRSSELCRSDHHRHQPRRTRWRQRLGDHLSAAGRDRRIRPRGGAAVGARTAWSAHGVSFTPRLAEIIAPAMVIAAHSFSAPSILCCSRRSSYERAGTARDRQARVAPHCPGSGSRLDRRAEPICARKSISTRWISSTSSSPFTIN